MQKLFKLSPKEVEWWPTMTKDLKEVQPSHKFITGREREILLKQFSNKLFTLNSDPNFRAVHLLLFNAAALHNNIQNGVTWDIDDIIFSRLLHSLGISIYYTMDARPMIKQKDVARVERVASLSLRLDLPNTYRLLKNK